MEELLNSSMCPNDTGLFAAMEECDVTTDEPDPYPDKDTINDVWYRLVGIGGSLLASVGMVINVMTLIVLFKREMRNTSGLYLIAITVYDLIFLVLSCMFVNYEFFHYGLTGNMDYYYDLVNPGHPVGSNIINVMTTASVYTTIALSIDRSIGVTRPFQWPSICTKFRVKIVLLFCLLWSVLVNGPIFGERYITSSTDPATNKSDVLSSPLAYGDSHFHSEVYLKFLNPIFDGFLPAASIAIVNAIIIVSLKRQQRAHAEMTNMGGGGDEQEGDDGAANPNNSMVSKRARETNRITGQVIFISVFTFFSRAFRSTTFTMMEIDGTKHPNQCFLACGIIAAISNFLLTVNATVNFICYCIFGQKFRNCFVRTYRLDRIIALLPCRRKPAVSMTTEGGTNLRTFNTIVDAATATVLIGTEFNVDTQPILPEGAAPQTVSAENQGFSPSSPATEAVTGQEFLIPGPSLAAAATRLNPDRLLSRHNSAPNRIELGSDVPTQGTSVQNENETSFIEDGSKAGPGSATNQTGNDVGGPTPKPNSTCEIDGPLSGLRSATDGTATDEDGSMPAPIYAGIGSCLGEEGPKTRPKSYTSNEMDGPPPGSSSDTCATGGLTLGSSSVSDGNGGLIQEIVSTVQESDGPTQGPSSTAKGDKPTPGPSPAPTGTRHSPNKLTPGPRYTAPDATRGQRLTQGQGPVQRQFRRNRKDFYGPPANAPVRRLLVPRPRLLPRSRSVPRFTGGPLRPTASKIYALEVPVADEIDQNSPLIWRMVPRINRRYSSAPADLYALRSLRLNPKPTQASKSTETTFEMTGIPTIPIEALKTSTKGPKKSPKGKGLKNAKKATKKSTKALKTPTESLIASAGAPIATTGAPIASDGAPIGSDGAPFGSDGAPIGSDGAQIGSDGAPIGSAEAPTGSAEAPTGSAAAPTGSAEAPNASAGAPIASDGAPIDSADAPIDSADAPIGSAEAPTGFEEAPTVSAGAQQIPNQTASDPNEVVRAKNEASTLPLREKSFQIKYESKEENNTNLRDFLVDPDKPL